MDRWSFALTTADAANPTTAVASSAQPPSIGVWTHLVGVYDAAAGQVRLYVNGKLAGETTAKPVWNATGVFRAGRRTWAGALGSYLQGDVDDVRVYSGVLTSNQISDLRQGS